MLNEVIKHKIRQSNVLVEATYAQEFTPLELKQFELGLANFTIEDLYLYEKKQDKVCSFSRAYLAATLKINPSIISQEAHRISSSLMTKYIEIQNILEDGTVEFKQIGIATYSEYVNGQFNIHWNYRLIPFLLEIKNNFTEFYLHYLFILSSTYAMKLYKLLYQYKNIKVRKFLLVDLKKQFGITDKYPLYGSFKQFVIETSIKQINEKTDLDVEYTEIKTGRKVESLEFRFHLKKQSIKSSSIESEIINVEPIENSNIIPVNSIDYSSIDLLLGNKANDISFKTKDFIIKLLADRGEIFVECSIDYAKKNSKTNFEKYLLDTVENNWAKADIQKLESKRHFGEIEKQKKQVELDLVNKQVELENVNKSEIEHLFLKLSDSGQMKYSSLANNILNKHVAKLKHTTIEALSYSIFAVSNGRYYDKKIEVYVHKFLNVSLNINDYINQ